MATDDYIPAGVFYTESGEIEYWLLDEVGDKIAQLKVMQNPSSRKPYIELHTTPLGSQNFWKDITNAD